MRDYLKTRILRLVVVMIALSGFANLAAQDVPAVKAEELKKTPQKYWASFFVFEDVLEKTPGDSTITIDDVEYTRFETRTIGTVYAEAPMVERLRALEVGSPYLFVGTVNQKAAAFFGMLGGSRFVVIVRDYSQPRQDTINITGRIPELELQLTTNRVNQTFARLDELFKEIQTDMLGFANSQGITIEEVFNGTAYRDKVASSVRSALRRYEEKSRGNSQELFVDVMVSMMAVQYGYGEPKHEQYEPAEMAPEAPAVLEAPAPEEPAADVDAYPEVESAKDWDIGEVIKDIETPAVTEPAPAASPADAAAPHVEPPSAPDAESAPAAPAVDAQKPD